MNPSVCRQALYVSSQGRPLFAWLHHNNATTDHGVVICAPFGHEQVHSHRSLRHLADALARAGFLVCRFDYHGTGDSPGTDEDPDLVAAWRTNITDIMQWMQRERDCRQISVVGVRLGALLALDVVSDLPVANLVLWVPVVKGRQYTRELEALSLMSGPPAASSDVEAAGFVVTPPTADALAKLDALKSRPRCQRALIVARDDLSEDRKLVDHLNREGVDAIQIREPGFAEMMVEPHNTKVPHQVIAAIVGWLGAAAETGKAIHVETNRCTEAAVTSTVRERLAIVKGPQELFAIITEPAGVPQRDLPLIVMVNAGSAYRVGPNRVYVLLARELARHGFRVMRPDVAGLGDSAMPDDARENDPYAPTIFRDIDLALQYGQHSLGAEQIVVMGLCSGAYAAFQAAAQFSNPAFVECVLINPLTYFWTDGMSLESPPAKKLAAFHYYMRAAVHPSRWLRFLTGQTKIGLVEAIKMIANHWRRRPRPEAGDTFPCSSTNDATVTHPEQDNLTGDLTRAIGAGRNVSCFFSRSDPGYSILMYHARRKVKEFCRTGKMNIFFVENADHTFSRRTPRRNAICAIVDYLCERYRK
jgi:alpha-beta hydrolase superfamily lysophospholipase